MKIDQKASLSWFSTLKVGAWCVAPNGHSSALAIRAAVNSQPIAIILPPFTVAEMHDDLASLNGGVLPLEGGPVIRTLSAPVPWPVLAGGYWPTLLMSPAGLFLLVKGKADPAAKAMLFHIADGTLHPFDDEIAPASALGVRDFTMTFGPAQDPDAVFQFGNPSGSERVKR